MASARDDRNLAVRLGACVALFLLLVGQAQVTVLDGSSMLAVAQSLVHDGTFSVPPELGVRGHDGRFYSKYGLLLPLLATVPVALVQPLGAVTGRVELLEAAAAASLMPLVVGGLVAALFALGRRLGAPRAAAALVAAGTALGTYVLPYGRDFFTEPLVAVGLVVAVERALAGRDLQAGTALALAVLARPQSAAFAPPLLAFLAARSGGVRAVARAGAPLAIAAAVTVAYNLLRFADPLEFGYRPPVDPGFTTPLTEGTAGLLFSPEKSIVLFAPAIVLVPRAAVALWRAQRRAVVALVLAVFALTWVLAATWHSWQGGWSWGPRLLIPGVVLVLALIAPWLGRNRLRLRVAVGLFAAGFVLSLPAVLAPAGRQLLERPPEVGPRIDRQYADLPQLARASLRAAGSTAARDDDYRGHLALWQAGLTRQVGPWGLLPATLGTLLLAAALVAVARPLAPRLRVT